MHGTLESSNEDVRELLKENLNEIMTNQANTYDMMTEYGWYEVNNIDSDDISQTLNKIKSKN